MDWRGSFLYPCPPSARDRCLPRGHEPSTLRCSLHTLPLVACLPSPGALKAQRVSAGPRRLEGTGHGEEGLLWGCVRKALRVWMINRICMTRVYIRSGFFCDRTSGQVTTRAVDPDTQGLLPMLSMERPRGREGSAGTHRSASRLSRAPGLPGRQPAPTPWSGHPRGQACSTERVLSAENIQHAQAEGFLFGVA